MPLEHEPAAGSVQLLETQTAVRQADALRYAIGGNARAVVGDGDLDGICVAASPNDNSPSAGAPSDSVVDGVLHQRLENEQRHADLEQPWIDVDGNRQAVPKSDPHDIEIRLEHRQLLPQRNFLHAPRLQAEA